MNIQWIYWLGSLSIAFLAFYFGRKDREKLDTKQAEQEAKQEVRQDTALDLNVKYIKESVDDMRLEQKDTNRKLEKYADENTEIKIKQAKMEQEIKVLNNAVFGAKKGAIHD